MAWWGSLAVAILARSMQVPNALFGRAGNGHTAGPSGPNFSSASGPQRRFCDEQIDEKFPHSECAADSIGDHGEDHSMSTLKQC